MKTLGGGHFELVAWIAGSLSSAVIGPVAIHYIGWQAAVAVATSVAIGGLLRKGAQSSWVIMFVRRIEWRTILPFSPPFAFGRRIRRYE